MALGQAFSVVAIMEAQVVNPFGNALVPDMIADASIQEIDGMFLLLCHDGRIWKRVGNVRASGGMEVQGFRALEFRRDIFSVGSN